MTDRSDRDQPIHSDDDIANLVRLADRRTGVAADCAMRVHTAVRAIWREEFERRRRRRRSRNMALLATAATLALAVVASRTHRPEDHRIATGNAHGPAQIEVVSGHAWSRALSSSPQSVAVGQYVAVGATVETADDARLALTWRGSHSIRLDYASSVQFVDDRTVHLLRGGLYIDSGPNSEATTRVIVQTESGVVREIGTQFEVRLQDSFLIVRLREGEVVLTDPRGDHALQAGQQLRRNRVDGSIDRQAFDRSAPYWHWLTNVTPMFDVAGRTAQEFLVWVAREKGLELMPADPQVHRQLSTTVIRGTIRALTIDQALDVVLPSCRLSYRIDQGKLLISRQP